MITFCFITRKLLYCGNFLPKLCSGLGVKLLWEDRRSLNFAASVSSTTSVTDSVITLGIHEFWLPFISLDSLLPMLALSISNYSSLKSIIKSETILRRFQYLGSNLPDWLEIIGFNKVTVRGGGGGGTTSKCNLIFDFSIEGLLIMFDAVSEFSMFNWVELSLILLAA